MAGATRDPGGARGLLRRRGGAARAGGLHRHRRTGRSGGRATRRLGRDELVVPVGRQVVPVVEQDDAVAEPAPALAAAVRDHVGAAAVGVVYVRARRSVAAHRGFLPRFRVPPASTAFVLWPPRNRPTTTWLPTSCGKSSER